MEKSDSARLLLEAQPGSRLAAAVGSRSQAQSLASRSARFSISSAFQVSSCPRPLFSRSGLSLKPPSMSRFIANGWSEYSEL